MGMTMNMLMVEAESGGVFLRVGDRGEIVISVGASNPASSSTIRIDNATGSPLNGQVSRMPTRPGQTLNEVIRPAIPNNARRSISLDNFQGGEQTFLVNVSLRTTTVAYMITLTVTNAQGGQNRCRFIGVAMWP
jgi:hypothetical protein